MRILTEESKKLIDSVLNEVDIYHINDYPVSAIGKEGPIFKNPIAEIRWKYLFSTEGLLTQGNRMYDPIRRTFSWMSEADYSNSLRQRLNIVHTLLNTEMESNLPVHISFMPRGDNRYLDLHTFSRQDFLTVIHPGYTRAVGSLFLNSPLKNVLVYINKEYKVKIEKNLSITKINNSDELLRHYKPFNIKEFDNQKYVYDFIVPGKEGVVDIQSGTKIHIPTNTRVLKCKSIKLEGVHHSNVKLHPGSQYIKNTIISFEDFFEILFQNEFTVYTDNVGVFTNSRRRNSVKLLEDKLGTKDLNITCESLLDFHPHITRFGGKQVSNEILPYRDSRYEIGKKLNELKYVQYPNKPLHLLDPKGKQVIKVPIGISTEDIVEQNNYKGFALYVESGKVEDITRNYFEFLFHIPPDVSIARLTDNSVRVVNCSHEYWTTGENYNELIINESFLKV